MIDLCLLGTGGTMPLPERWLTSLLIRWNGHEVLIDCGEGTQIALHAQKLSCRHIDTILITHYHADHTAGLPGLLLSMAKSGRVEPIQIYGPKGIDDLRQGVQFLARYVPFEVNYTELPEKENSFMIDDLEVTSFPLKHAVFCLGYSFRLARTRKFDRAKAEENNVPMQYWGKLQKGQTVETEECTYTPEMVLGEERKGIHFVYATDTRPLQKIARYAENADLLIAEGMYGDPDKSEKAKLNKHMTMQESASLAAKANVKQLWFTHYSPSVDDPNVYAEEIHEIFPRAIISSDGQKCDLKFAESEEES